ncbi:MAG: metalloregulator ArsR/SmtB family transcription factor [bacterium]|nr:metalloregulator ArsR/SmtB family transcription factor [bacterium]
MCKNSETKESQTARYKARAKIIKAMAHPTRLLLVDRLSRGESCVRELTDLVGDDISTVSKHLSRLKEVGIVEDNRRGLQVWYRLKVPCVMDFFGCVESVLESNCKAEPLQQIRIGRDG